MSNYEIDKHNQWITEHWGAMYEERGYSPCSCGYSLPYIFIHVVGYDEHDLHLNCPVCGKQYIISAKPQYMYKDYKEITKNDGNPITWGNI